MTFFINDGFTLEETIPAKGIIPALKFKFRPALPQAVNDYRIAFNNARDGKGRIDAENKLLFDQLISWDAVYKDADNKLITAPIIPEWLNRIPDSVRMQLIEWVIWGMEKHEEATKNSSSG